MEIALALVVVGIGMTAIVGIFPIALNTAADNNQQSRMALLGEEIAHGLRTKVLEEGAVENGGTLDWKDPNTPNFGGQLKLDLVMADLPSAEIWTPVTESIEILTDGTYHGFIYLAHATGLADGVDNHNIGYRVVIKKPAGARAFTWPTVREVRIELFETHSSRNMDDTVTPDLVYYTEIHKPVEVR
jgi:hypothetical protein